MIGLQVTNASEKKMKQSKIGFVYFDVGQVLVSAKKGWREFAKQKRFDKKMTEKFWRIWGECSDLLCEGRMEEKEINDRLAKEIGKDLGSDFSLIGVTVEMFEPIAEMQALVGEVAKKYPVGLLSNAYPEMLRLLMASGKLPRVEYVSIIDSYEVKLVKPDPRIYELATNKSGHEAGEILFIDDNQLNIQAAEKAGWQTYWFDEDKAETEVEELRKILF